ncbi:MAG TPA: hypothetical protein VG992_04175 [Candidatus Saccharimonadales bacterium]|nr:hypothetical protein [Candidatus Saccharimonadales bacterium]
MTEIIDYPVWHDRVVVEHIVAEPAFDELLETAIDMCLTAPGRYERHLERLEAVADAEEPTTEQLVARRLGAWGLRTAVEMTKHPREFIFGGRDELPDGQWLLVADSSIEHPRHFSGEVKPHIQRQIEAFGQAVIDEAFWCLGDDVLTKVEAWQAATTAKEQREILTWLCRRVADMRDRFDEPAESNEAVTVDEDGAVTLKLSMSPDEATVIDTPESDDDEHYYHPARLSPKLLGQFPDVGLPPTCLGLSILVAAFAEKAGIPYMHGGVAESNSHSVLRQYDEWLEQVQPIAQAWKLALPDDIDQNLKTQRAEGDIARFKDEGYHAAIYLKFVDGTWGQVDPNFHSNIMLRKGESQDIESMYTELQAFSHITPGFTYMHQQEWYFSPAIGEALLHMRYKRSPSMPAIERYLLAAETPTIAEVADHFIKRVLFGSRDNEIKAIARMYETQLKRQLEPHKGAQRTLTEGLMDSVIRDFVFSDTKDNDLQASLERCKRDPAYRRRRVEDLKLAPVYFLTRLNGMLTNGVLDHFEQGPHRQMEVGLAPYRIGASILSDMAVYTGDELPASFWLTYWPSHIAVTEHIPDDIVAANRGPLHNVAGIMERTHLRYMKSYGIINKFLEQDPVEGSST